MEKKTLCFDVDASQIDIKPILKKEFLELTMRAISTANPNRNNSWFTKESLLASIGTFKEKPILGYFENGDFVSHNGEWKEDPETKMDYWDTNGAKGERPIGLIREKDEVQVIDDEKTGLSWVVLTCALWTQYNYKQVKRLLKDAIKAKQSGAPTKNISVEVDITDWEMLENGVMKINAFNLVGITILGSRNGVKVEPGIEDAELSVVDIMGTALYEKQLQNLRLAYEKLDGSETVKEEDFSKMEVKQEEVVTPVVETPTPVVEEPAKEEPVSQDVHFEEENHDTDASDPDKIHENEEKEDGEDDDEDKNDDVCPECGKNPCECAAKHEKEECVCEDPEEHRDPIRDIAWLISDVSWNIVSFQDSIEYYEKHEEIPGRDYILAVLRRFKAQAEENEKELAGLMAKVAEGISEEELQYAEQLCGHCDCKAEYSAYQELNSKYEDLAKECDEAKVAKVDLEQKFAEIEKAKAHEQFMAEAKEVINSAKLPDEMVISFEKECEDGTINTLEALKTQIGLKLFELKAKEEAPEVKDENVSFDAPVNNPDVNSFAEDTSKAKKKDKWELLREMNKK